MKKRNASIAESFWLVLHAKLLNDLRKLKDALRSTTKQGHSEIHARLVATFRDVSEHFDFEERYGYMESVRTHEPRLDGEIRDLLLEHAQLRQSLDGIITSANGAMRDKVKIRRAVRRWINRLREHEARENELIEAALKAKSRPGLSGRIAKLE